MATRSLNVVISGDAKPLGVAAKQADGHLNKIGESGAKMGKALALGFATAGAAAAGALAVGLKKSVDAAKEAEVSQARLKAQLDASGISYRAHAKEIDAVIQKHSQLAGIDDEDLQDAFTNLVRSTGSVSKAMHDMGLVTDLARAKHIDVTKAADLLGKVHAGNVGVLKRYGIAFDPVTKAQDKLKESNVKATAEQIKAAKAADKAATSQQAIAELQKRFGGQAEAYGKTAAGAQERFGVALENVEEKLGAHILPVLTKVTGGVADFIAGIDSGKGAGGRFAAGVSDAFNRVKTVVQRVIAQVRGYLDDHQADIQSVIRAFQRIAEFAKTTFQETLLPMIRRSIAAIRPILEGLGDFIKGIVRVVSGLLSGNWSKAWDGAKEAVSGAWKAIKTAVSTGIDNLWELIKDLGPKLIRLIVKGLEGLGKSLATGIWEGIKAAAKAVPTLAAETLKGIGGAITGVIQKGLGKINIFGDGTGKGDGLGVTMNIPNFGTGGSLMGASPQLAPIAGAASRFGLHTSSGLRPGAITTSGNVSYHSSGEALDEAGTPAGMMGFFNFMKNTMGGRLAELIYGPGQVGIKNGRPFNFGPALNAQHMDHVHVAMDLGHPGVGIGDGLGQFTATAYGPPWGGIQGTGVTATGVNLKGNPHTYGVAVDPRVIPLGTKLRITPNPFNYGGTFTAFDTGGAIKGHRIDFYDWRGRSAQLGWGTRSVTVSTVTGSSGGASAPAKGRPGVDRGGLGHVDPAYVNGGDAADPDSLLTPPAARTVGDLRGKRPKKGYLPGDPIPQPVETATTGPLAALQDRLDLVEAQERAGDIDSATAARLRDHLRTQALNGYFGGLSDREQLQVRGDLREAMLALKDSITDTLTGAIESLQAEIKRQTDFATSVTSTSNYQLTKSLADLIGGQIVGYGVAGRAFTPGRGTEYAY